MDKERKIEKRFEGELVFVGQKYLIPRVKIKKNIRMNEHLQNADKYDRM